MKTPPDEPLGDHFPEEEPTRVDLIPTGETTPVVLPVCPDCGGSVLTDDFDLPSLAGFPSDRCVRGMFGRWWSCARLKRAVFYWG